MVTSTDSASRLHIDGLTVMYGSDVAIADASFSVEPGELCVLVGPSGSGKSTILRAIAGYAPIKKGDIFIGDARANELPPEDRDIAMVFQQRALYPHMTVWQNWAFPLEAIKTPKREIQQRVAEIGRILQMSPFLNRYPRELSGGQQQRVAIGRALIRRPRGFLLDEPLSGLDAKLRIETRSYIKRLHGDLGATMVYVTHNHVEAQAIGDMIVVLNANRVQQVGTPDEIYNQPNNVFVAEFLGSPPINFINCDISVDGDNMTLTHKSHQWEIDPQLAARLQDRVASSSVILGVRPEDIALFREGGARRVPAEVYVTEPQGHEIIVDLLFGDEILRARQDRETGLGESLNINDAVFVEFDLARSHIFDRDSGLCLTSD